MKSELSRIVLFGMAAGVIATVLMDIFVAIAMIAMGNPVAFMFIFIGEVAAKFFSLLNITVPGGPGLGLLFHYLFGMGYGGLFCWALSKWPRFKPAVLSRTILLGILYIEIFSQPFLASAPLVLRLSTSDTLQWYGLSTVMHAVYGAVLGLLEYYRKTILAGLPAAQIREIHAAKTRTQRQKSLRS